MSKTYASKSLKEQVWTDNESWTIHRGKLTSRGRPQNIDPLFLAVGEKLPLSALDSVKKNMQDNGISQTYPVASSNFSLDHQLYLC